MKKNVLIMCLINNVARDVAQEFSHKTGFNFLDLSQVFNEIEINSKTDLNMVAQNSNSITISKEQLKIMLSAQNAVFVSNNFNLMSENFLAELKKICAVVFIKVGKNDYLEFKWTENLTNASKFKIDAKVFDLRRAAYINCADIVLDGCKSTKTMCEKLLKSLENL